MLRLLAILTINAAWTRSGVAAFSRSRVAQSFGHRRHSAEGYDAAWELELAEYDVVEYADGDALGLGVYHSSDGMLHPLCTFDEEGEKYVYDEEVDAIDAARAVRIVDDVFFTTRQAQRGVDNPHGEHAEDVFEIAADVLDERCVVAFRPERDIVWG
mmetsp:Transcript_23169/g.69397  ORF Transcript_23169/g.69397 Transcript_23169/m.69397 type:complete len:157 (+) Transcript_23169:169-639(+)